MAEYYARKKTPNVDTFLQPCVLSASVVESAGRRVYLGKEGMKYGCALTIQLTLDLHTETVSSDLFLHGHNRKVCFSAACSAHSASSVSSTMLVDL